ncbi:hypothetical protein MGAST_17350 [Mycobacterium gastri 'Wayne']|nr:hypothetical protein MGAST_17350 [Mycobacterium gastri 'Wayne']
MVPPITNAVGKIDKPTLRKNTPRIAPPATHKA